MYKNQFCKSFLLLLIFSLLIQGILLHQEGPAHAESNAVQKLTIIHTNDIQGQIVPQEATWKQVASPPEVGGLASLRTYIAREKRDAHRENRGLIVLDAGDWFTGTPESDLNEGKAMIQGLNEIPIDFTTIGNHEFDVGVQTLIKRIQTLQHTVLTTNVRYKTRETEFPGTKKWAIIDRNGLKVGIFGVLTDKMRQISPPGTLNNTFFLDKFDQSRKAVKALRNQGAQIVIALSHIGLESDRQLARKVPGIDLIIGGHSHTRLNQPENIDGTIIAQAGSSLSDVGRINLEVDPDNGRILYYRGGLITLSQSRYPPDSEVQEVLNPYLRKVEDRLSETVGRADTTIKRTAGASSPLGNMITDAMKINTHSDIAFQNSFGIRDNIYSGTITRRTLYEVLPFGNELVEMTLTGNQIKQVLEQSVSFEKGLLQLSGAKVVTDPDKPGDNRLISIKINGEPLKNRKKYRIVTNSFLAEGGDRFTTFEKGTNREVHSGLTLRNVLTDYILKRDTISPVIETRYELKNPPPKKFR